MDSIKDYIVKFLRLENLVDHLSGYVETKVALVKMEIREEVAHALSRGLVSLVVMLFGFLFLLFLSIGVAQYINTFFEGEYVGYWIVGGFFGFVFAILLIFKKSILHSLEKRLIEMIRKKER